MEPRRARTRWLAPAAQAAAACLALSLAGCNVSIGIGSFDDGDAMIDPGNAASAVAAGFDTLAALAGPALGLSDEPLRVPAGERPRRALVPGTFDWLEWAAPLRGAALPVAGGRFSSSLTLACHSGTVRVTAVFLNPAVFGAGDTIDLEAAACRFDGVVFDGRVTMSVVSASGYPGTSAAWTARVSVGFSGWRVGTVALPLQARTVGGTAVLDARRFDALEAAIDFDSPALSVEPVVSGTARVTNGREEHLVGVDESTYIPAGTPHRLSNPGRIDCVMIEVQSGDYVGEDDIVRLEDHYGRAG